MTGQSTPGAHEHPDGTTFHERIRWWSNSHTFCVRLISVNHHGAGSKPPPWPGGTRRSSVLHVVPTFEPMPVRSGSLDGPVQMVYPVSREEVLEDLRCVVDDAGAGSIQGETSTSKVSA